jgi:hypothetical protein
MSESEEGIEVAQPKVRYGIVNESLLEDCRLNSTARLIGAWLGVKRPGWKVYRSQLLQVLGLGRDAYQKARRQLIACGYLTMRPKRSAHGRFTAPLWLFDQWACSGTATGDGFSGSGEAAPGKSGAGGTGSGLSGCLPKPKQTTPSLTTPPPLAAAVVVVSGAGSMGQKLNVELGGDSAAMARVDRASDGASPEQVELAVEEVRRQVAAGTARSPVGLAVTLAKLAVRGAVTAQAAPKHGEAAETAWHRRAAAAGRYVEHPKLGRHTVLLDGRAWRRESDGLTISGSQGLKLWARVESGELQLLP